MTEPGRWQLAKDEPRSATGWLLARLKRGGVPPQGVVILAAAALISAFAQTLIPFVVVGLAVCLLINLNRSQRRLLQTLELPELKDDTKLLLARVTVVDQSGSALGEDDGSLTLVDGWLIYEGLRTRFALRKSDVESVGDNQVLRLKSGQVLKFTPPKMLFQTLVQLDLPELYRTWLDEPEPPGESSLPPQTTHPEQLAKTVLIPLITFLGVGILGAVIAFQSISIGLLCLGTLLLISLWLRQRMLRLRHAVNTLPTRTAE